MVARVLKERYAIQQQLGKNAGRQTLLARDLQTQELVAIKLLTFAADFQWDALKLFEREAQTLQSLSHPAVPRYLDHFEFQTSKSKGFALVQSYIEAKSLEEWVKLERTFNEGEIKQLAKALLEILMYLHGQHPPVIHRDIKPSNILLEDSSSVDNGNQVYLVDFGSVQTLAAREGSTITVVGTYGYMPPEQFGGRAVPASDLYSLGATLIYLVTGTHPADLPQEDLRIQFEPKIHLSSAFVDWLKWMTEPELNNRLTSTEKALSALKSPVKRDVNVTSLVVEKPQYSKVQIKKDRNSLELVIPPFCSVINYLVGIFCSFIVGIIIFKPSIMTGLMLAIMLVPRRGFLRSTRLYLNQEQIFLTYQWLWYKCQKPPISKKDIYELIYTQRSWITTRNSKGNSSTSLIAPNIIIRAKQQKYKLSADTQQLTDPEIDWLAHELIAWSGRPITVEQGSVKLKQALIARKPTSS